MWAVVVAQLVEWLITIPEVRGSNPVIGKKLYILDIYLLWTVHWKDENKEKEAGNGPFLTKAYKGAAIAKSIRLSLPSRGPVFEYQYLAIEVQQ